MANWNSLSLRDKADIISVAINNGVTTLPEIKEAYNKFADGGSKKDYSTWRKLMKKHYGFDVGDPNSDYDMEAYYNRHTDEAWDRLNKAPHHFNDGDEYGTFKTLNHPTYPDRGNASWNKEETIFYPSERQMEDSDRILDYLGSDHAYNNGATKVSYEGGTVLPTVYSTPSGGYIDLRRNKLNTGWVYSDRPEEYSDGGSIHIKPSHEGRFTELKERTGHSTSWFLENGTPAQKKMANFARNASHWNHHADGGNLFDSGGYTPSKAVRKRITDYEGASMATNNSFASEASRFTSALPDSIRAQVLSNPELADSLYSYSYNVGAGKFKERVVPALLNYYNGDGTVDDITNSMWASGDKKLRGLRRRRNEEKAGVRNALISNTKVPLVLNTPIIEEDPTIYKAPVIDETLFSKPTEQIDDVYNPEQERLDNLQKLNMFFSMTGTKNPLEETTNVLENPLIELANNYGYNI